MAKNNPPDGGQKIIVIVGPTASGKSDLAVRIAKKVEGEIISADSRQVYRGMDIGTGKITKKRMLGVPHHLLDVASPKSEFNVSHFKKLATKKIKEITRPVRGRSPRGGRSCAVGRAASNGVNGHVPIIVGGTGFWIDALIYDWPIPEVRANRALRARLEKWPAAQLFAKLQKLDPARAASIQVRNEINNKRRLIRALEIVLDSDQPSPKIVLPSYYDRNKKEVAINGKKYETLILGIKVPKKELEKRIYKRLTKRLKAGMIEEIKKLHKSGVSWKRLDNFGLEYRYVSRYLRNLITYDQMVEQLYSAIKNYAKRQMRWFKRNSQIRWLTPSEATRNKRQATSKTTTQAIKLVRKFLYR